MFNLIDNLFPWFGDMLELGGDILLLIIWVAALMWTLIFERLAFFTLVFPGKINAVKQLWHSRSEHKSWQATQFRQLMVSRLSRDMQRNLELIRTLVKLCPLLGLLGTVLGMLEIFDALAVTGNNSARTTAGGVSKATVSTMAGMVVAISGLMISNYLINKADQLKLRLQDSLHLDDDSQSNAGEKQHA